MTIPDTLKKAMRVQQWPVDRPVPYKNNPRKITDAAIAKVVASIREFGFQQPIVVDAKGIVIVGHTRLAAAKTLGLKTVPVVVADMPATKAKAYRIADNRTNQESGWDDDLLKIEFSELAGLDIDLSLTAFDPSEIDAVMRGGGLTDPDEVPEAPVTPVSRIGDLWVLGKHRLLCGDSTKAEDVARVLGDVKPHLMVTDPPYGVSYDPGWRGKARNADGSLLSTGDDRAVGKVTNDNRADWREALNLFPGEVAYCWHAGLRANSVFDSLVAAGFNIRAQIIWAKNSLVIGRGHYHFQHEPCWYAVRDKAGATGHWQGDRTQTTLWQIDKPQKSETGHSTQKPVECMRRPIENNSSPGQAVYDPFVGSFTTGIACEMTGRSCLAIEIDQIYVDVGILRFQKFSGKQGVLEETGETFEQVLARRAQPAASAQSEY